MIRAGRPSSLLLLLAGFVIWASAFSFLYGVFSLGCELGWHYLTLFRFNLMTFVLLAIWLAHLALLGWLLQVCWERFRAQRDAGADMPRFIETVAVAATAAALFSTAWTGLPILTTTACL